MPVVESRQADRCDNSSTSARDHRFSQASLGLPVADHLEPVQLLFQLVEGVVADLIARAHGEHGLPRRIEGVAMEVVVIGAPLVPGGRCGFGGQMCPQLMTDGVGDRRLIARKARESSL